MSYVKKNVKNGLKEGYFRIIDTSCYDIAPQDIVHINDYTFKKRFPGTREERKAAAST
jgi:hypothetical protein